MRKVIIAILMFLSSAAVSQAQQYADLQTRLADYVSRQDARVGVAVIVDGKDTIDVNGRRDFPMLSVYKFPQAIAVADYCRRLGIQTGYLGRRDARQHVQPYVCQIRQKLTASVGERVTGIFTAAER